MERTDHVDLSELSLTHQGVGLVEYFGEVRFPFEQNVPESPAETVGESDDSVFRQLSLLAADGDLIAAETVLVENARTRC